MLISGLRNYTANGVDIFLCVTVDNHCYFLEMICLLKIEICIDNIFPYLSMLHWHDLSVSVSVYLSPNRQNPMTGEVPF